MAFTRGNDLDWKECTHDLILGAYDFHVTF